MNIFPDIPRPFTALAEWGACAVYIAVLRRRLHGWRLGAVMVLSLVCQILFLHFTGLRFIDLPSQWLTNLLWLLCMAIAVGGMFLLLCLCCEAPWTDLAYHCMRAFVLAEFAASLEWQIQCFLWPENKEPWFYPWFLLLAVFGVIFLITWLLERRQTPGDGTADISKRELLSAGIIALAVFSVSNLGFLPLRTPFSTDYDTGLLITRTVIDLGGFAILYAHYVQCCSLRTRRELESMEQVLQNQYAQYQQSKESVDLINRKYHDLKHQIAVLRAEPDAGRRGRYLDEMEQDIKSYEAQNKTGNPVLDTILTSKSLYCIRQGVTLTSVVDGSLLDFMDVMDLSAIFGNALDNAIESVMRVEDPEKRLIHVTVSARKGFTLITFENYFEGELSFAGQLPVTTKGDRGFHGYGLKSIRYVAEKYGGSMTVQAEEQWFKLNILFPRPEET